MGRTPRQNIIEAIKLVCSRGFFIDGRINYLLITKNIHKNSSGELLTVREKNVLQLISLGLENKAIAARLSISPKTVSYHKENIKSKLGFSSVKGLYIKNLLDLDE